MTEDQCNTITQPGITASGFTVKTVTQPPSAAPVSVTSGSSLPEFRSVKHLLTDLPMPRPSRTSPIDK